MRKPPPLSGMTIAIIAVAGILILAIAGPYIPGATTGIIGLFQGKAKLSGEIFVTMQSGDVKRGADVEVGLVRVDDAFQAAWDGILRDYRSVFDEGLKRSEQAQARYHSLPSTSFDLRRAALEDWRQANAALGEVPGPFQQRARALIGPNLVTTVRGNADGRYHFTGVPQGRYYVIAQYKVFDNALKWAVPITLKSGDNTLNLTNSNGNSPIP